MEMSFAPLSASVELYTFPKSFSIPQRRFNSLLHPQRQQSFVASQPINISTATLKTIEGREGQSVLDLIEIFEGVLSLRSISKAGLIIPLLSAILLLLVPGAG